jgi:hypothetical protein
MIIFVLQLLQLCSGAEGIWIDSSNRWGGGSPLFIAMLSAALFSVAHDLGHKHGTQMYEASNLKNAARS